MKNFSWWLAIGEGEEHWGETPPSVPLDVEGLSGLQGFVRARQTAFVIPAAGGEIVTNGGMKWTSSVEPTRYLFVKFVLEFADAQPSILREIAVYLDAEPKDDVPPGQNYIPAGDMTSFGHLYGIDRFSAIVRDGSKRQVFTTIMTF